MPLPVAGPVVDQDLPRRGSVRQSLQRAAVAPGADCHGVITMHPLEFLAFTYGCIWEPLNDVEPPPVDPVRVIIPVWRGGGFDEIAVLPVTYV